MGLYIFSVAVVNVALGFALAVYLGRRAQTVALAQAGPGMTGTFDALAIAGQAAGPVAAEEDAGESIARIAGVDQVTAEWWKNDAQHARQLAVALFDVDQLGQINQQHGVAAGDRILQALTSVFQNEQRGENVVARFTNERFVFLFPDADVRYATNVAERIRQTVEATHFEYQDGRIPLTVSCAVVGAIAADTPDSLCDRADAALRESKRYGRNRTFLYEGKYPTPVVPPKFAMNEKRLPI